jgi:hypothetical protein
MRSPDATRVAFLHFIVAVVVVTSGCADQTGPSALSASRSFFDSTAVVCSDRRTQAVTIESQLVTLDEVPITLANGLTGASGTAVVKVTVRPQPNPNAAGLNDKEFYRASTGSMSHAPSEGGELTA